MRTYLKEGTIIRVPGGVLYQISGDPIGEGGGSIIYPVSRYLPDGQQTYQKSPILYALKECCPLSSKYIFLRDEKGEIIPEKEEADARTYLERVKKMQSAENSVTGDIYQTGFRLTPVLETFQEVELSSDQGQTYQKVRNSVSVMESLAEKGQSLKHYLKEKHHLPVLQTFRIIEQVLYAVREVHKAGYLHLDLQDGNIFLKGQLDDNSGMISLIDFGSARRRMEDGMCEIIRDRVLYSTPGFSAPEIVSGNDGTLRLGPEADIYSVGCLALLLLTGHRSSFQELYDNQTGRYIPRFAVRKTKCPKHLIDRMQSILAKALANRPEDRYADVEEMQREITDFLTLLTPYKNPLSGTVYDAFICYKHGERDTLAARELRNALERYKGGRLSGPCPIKNVFLDEGELASCADFGERIREILKNTDWLVAICSKATRESLWVNDEIETFLKYHDPSHVLAVITEGEPGEVFPESLLRNGLDTAHLFAADARGDTTKQIAKKIKGDVKLRIAAPILQTTYDALKQRNKMYEMKRSFALISTVLLALSVFLAYGMVTSGKIANQALRIAEEHKSALMNQALYLAQQAQQTYEEHDPMRAMDQALQGCDLLAEEEIAGANLLQTLVRSMKLYTLPLNSAETVTAEGIFRLEKKGGFDTYFLDSSGTNLFTADDSRIFIWDTATFQCTKTITAPWTITKFDESFLLDQSRRFLVTTKKLLECYDYELETEVWQCGFDDGISQTVVSADETVIAVASGQKLYVLRAEDGSTMATLDLSTEGISLGHTVLAISPDKKWIAFTMEKAETDGEKEVWQTGVYNVEMDTCQVVWSEEEIPGEAADGCFHFTDDNRLVVALGEGENTVFTGDVVTYSEERKNLNIGVYDPVESRMLWEDRKEYMSLDEKIIFCDTVYDDKKALLFVYGKNMEFLERNTGKILERFESDAPVISAWCGDKKATFVLENGDLLCHSYTEKKLRGYGYFPENLIACCSHGEDYYVRKKQDASYQSDAAIVRYRENVSDSGYELCAVLEDEKEAEDYLPDEMLYPTSDVEVSIRNGEMTARIEGNSIVVKRENQLSESMISCLESPLSLFWDENAEVLLVGYADKAELYDMDTETLLDTVNFEKMTYVQAGWQSVDQGTVLFVGDTDSYLLHVSERSLDVMYSLKDLLAYDSREDVFYFLSTSYSFDQLDEGIFRERVELGKIRRYEEKEIIEMARERLDIR